MMRVGGLLSNVGYGILLGAVLVFTLTAYALGQDARPFLGLLVFMVALRLIYSLAYRLGQAWSERKPTEIAVDVLMLSGFAYVAIRALIYLVQNDPYPLR